MQPKKGHVNASEREEPTNSHCYSGIDFSNVLICLHKTLKSCLNDKTVQYWTLDTYCSKSRLIWLAHTPIVNLIVSPFYPYFPLSQFSWLVVSLISTGFK